MTSAENNANNNNNNSRTTSAAAQVAKTNELRQERSQGIGEGKKPQLNRTNKQDDSAGISESKITEAADASTFNGKYYTDAVNFQSI